MGIDAPEKKQALGNKSKESLFGVNYHILIKHTTVKVTSYMSFALRLVFIKLIICLY